MVEKNNGQYGRQCDSAISAKEKAGFRNPKTGSSIETGGERGIRTLDGTFAPYSLSRRAPSASSAISPKKMFTKFFYIKLRSNFMAEGVGFEPTEVLPSTVFKTAAFDHSAIPPFYRPNVS